MGMLSGSQISQAVQAGDIILRPFEGKLVQPASYDLRLGSKILASPLSEDVLGMKVELDDKLPSYRVHSGQMVAVLSEERVELPLDMCARVGIRSEFARRGVIAFGGPQIDPGYRGRIMANLMNVGPEAITLTLGAPLLTIEFQRLDQPAEVGYEGSYQDSDDFPEDQYEFILSARTTSLAEIPTLRQEVRRLSVAIEELGEKWPDPDEGLELKPEVEQRLRDSRSTPKDSLLSTDEMRRSLGT